MGFLKSLGVLLTLLILSRHAYGSSVLTDADLIRYSQGGFGTQIGMIRVVALIAPPPGNGGLTNPERYNRASVLSYFKELSRQSLLPIMSDIQNGKLPGVRVSKAYWINATLAADVTPDGLKLLAQHPSVLRVYKNGQTRREPTRERGASRPGKSPWAATQTNAPQDNVATKYDVSSLGLDRLFQEKPQINGSGVVVGVVDSGVDATHPALQGKVLAFYNGQTRTTSAPQDFEAHGTHVSGTIVGGDRSQNWIGVAPGAKIVMAGALQNYDTMIEGMQWFVDLDKNPDVARSVKAVNCSWNTDGATDQEVFYRAIAAWEAAGILPIFSVGNSGPNANTVTAPHEYPGAFDVGAYGLDAKNRLVVADFSSRGPGKFRGMPGQKPDITAPGVAINSSVPGGNYQQQDGTSMAAPHVTGAVALLLQINPQLNPAQLKQILLQSATTPNGLAHGQFDPGWGFGQLNIYNAVMGLLKMGGAAGQVSGLTFFTPSFVSDEMTMAANMGVVGEGADVY